MQNIDPGRIAGVDPSIVLKESTANRLERLGAELSSVPIEDAFFGEVVAEAETVGPPHPLRICLTDSCLHPQADLRATGGIQR